MGKEYKINWKDYPEKRPTLAATYALTKSWRASTAIWAVKFPNDARGVDDNDDLLKRLETQYRESAKNSLGWRDIPLLPDIYRAPENSIGQDVVRIARTLNIQLMDAPADSEDVGPGSGASHIPASPPATPRHDLMHQATYTQPSQVEQPETPRRSPRSSDRSTEAVYAPRTPPSSGRSKRPGKPDKSPMIDAARQDLTLFTPVSQREAHPDLECVMARFYLPNEMNAPLATGFTAGYVRLLNGVLSPAPESTNPMLFDFFQVRTLFD